MTLVHQVGHVAQVIATCALLIIFGRIHQPRLRRWWPMTFAITLGVASLAILASPTVLLVPTVLGAIAGGAVIAAAFATLPATRLPGHMITGLTVALALSGALSAAALLRSGFVRPTNNVWFDVLLGLSVVINAAAVGAGAMLMTRMSGSRTVFKYRWVNIWWLPAAIAAAVAWVVAIAARGALWGGSVALLVGLVSGVLLVMTDRFIGSKMLALLLGCTGFAHAISGFATANVVALIAGSFTAGVAIAIHRRTPGAVATARTDGDVTAMTAADAATLAASSRRVVVIPGYDVAASQSGDVLCDVVKQLRAHHVSVSVVADLTAGQVPGHMVSLLQDIGLGDGLVIDVTEADAQLAHADLAVVVGAPGRVVDGPAHPLDGTFDISRAERIIVAPGSAGLIHPPSDPAVQRRTNVVHGLTEDVLQTMKRSLLHR